jgi:hypothetical protein
MKWVHPSKPFQSFEKGNLGQRVCRMVLNLHSGISFTTANLGHEGEDLEILKRRHNFYQ